MDEFQTPFILTRLSSQPKVEAVFLQREIYIPCGWPDGRNLACSGMFTYIRSFLYIYIYIYISIYNNPL